MGVSGWMFLLVPAYPGCPDQRPLNGRCCCCIYIAYGAGSHASVMSGVHLSVLSSHHTLLQVAAVGPVDRRYRSVAAAVMGECGECHVVNVCSSWTQTYQINVTLISIARCCIQLNAIKLDYWTATNDNFNVLQTLQSATLHSSASTKFPEILDIFITADSAEVLS